MGRKKIDLSIVIVRYNVTESLYACIQSVIDTKPKISYEIVIVDNNPKKRIGKQLLKRFPQVVYVKNPKNSGFGSGMNLGVAHAHGTYVFIFNPDMLVFPGCLDNLVGFAKKRKDLAAVGPGFLDGNGNTIRKVGSKILKPIHGIVVLSFINKLLRRNAMYTDFYALKTPSHRVRRVEVLPGGCFVMKKELYEDLGGFDEKFFMYFEEFDLFKRLHEKYPKLSCFVIPNAVVQHEGGGDSQNIRGTPVFSNSRFYYFKKHYGLAWALLVQLCTEFRKEHALLILIVFLAAFLRFYRLEYHFPFFGEVGHNLLAIKDAFEKKYIPLIGPPTSHSWLAFGPLFYWIYGPVLALSRFNPVSYGYFGALISTLIVIVNFFVVSRLFSVRIALISSLLITVSPLFLFFSWGARFFSYIPLLSLIFLYCVLTMTQQSKRFFPIGILFGVMFSFHYTPLLLIPFFVCIVAIKKIIPTVRDVAYFCIGVLIPMIPLVIYDGITNSGMVRNSLLWIPYRVLGFFGIYNKNTVNSKIVEENFNSIVTFLKLSFVSENESNFIFILYCALVVYMIWYCIQAVRTKKIDTPFFALVILCVVSFIALFIHGSPPIHYFVPILFLPILCMSVLISTVWDIKQYGKVAAIGALILIVIVNLHFYFSKDWIYRIASLNIVPYTQQQQIAAFIVKDAAGQPYILRRVGLDDQFEGNYAQNYQYLLWLYGNEPILKATRIYTIYENRPVPWGKHQLVVKKIGGVIIVKEKK